MALEELQIQPDEYLFVGDHLLNDVEGPVKAGTEAIWMKVNQPWRDHVLAQPLYTIDHLSELLKLL